jgi:predicted O-methyltransferase YrrM
MLRDILRSFLPSRAPAPKIAKPGACSSELAEVIARAPPLDASTRAAVDTVQANVSRMKDPVPDPNYSTIAQHFASASSNPGKLKRLVAMVKWAKARSILEIGTGYGISAIAMAKAQSIPNLITIEVSEPQITIARRELAAAFPNGGVRQIAGNKSEILPRLVSDGHSFDFVFHDGGHTGDAYVRDYELILPMLAAGALVVIDDIRWDESPERRRRTTGSNRTCYEGWLDVVADSSVTTALEFGNVGVLRIDGERSLTVAQA